MSALRMAWTELRRITSSRGVIMTVMALLVVPMLYGGVYLYANHDPYSQLSNVPAALVVQDTGSVGSDGTRTTTGRDIADQLLADKAFDWQEVDAATARDGVRTGRFDFAMTIPAGFSADLATAGTGKARQAGLQLMTNDANNYIARTMATQATEKVRVAVAKEIGEKAATSFLTGYATIGDSLSTAADGATKLSKGATSADAGAADLATGSAALATGAHRTATGAAHLASASTDLASGLHTLSSGTKDLPSQTAALATGSASVAKGAAAIADSSTTLAAGSQQVTDGLNALMTSLPAMLNAAGVPSSKVQAVVTQVNALATGSASVTSGVTAVSRGAVSLSTGAQQVAGGAERLAAGTPALTDGIAKADTGATRLAAGAKALSAGSTKVAGGASDVADGASNLDKGMSELADGAATLATHLRDGAASVPTVAADSRATTAADLADPVAVTTIAETRAASYGAGLAPFFIALALWIGGYVLFLLLRPLSRRALAADQPAWRIAVGGWLTPALLGAVQVLGLVAVVAFGVGIVPTEPVATLAFLVLVSVTFIAIIQALSAWFGTAGQFLALVLMILQLVSSGGTFPWQTLPAPLAALHAALPMPHAITGLRQLFYGGDPATALTEAAVLVVFLIAALAATTLAARRQRRWTPARLQPAVVL